MTANLYDESRRFMQQLDNMGKYIVICVFIVYCTCR